MNAPITTKKEYLINNNINYSTIYALKIKQIFLIQLTNYLLTIRLRTFKQ